MSTKQPRHFLDRVCGTILAEARGGPTSYDRADLREIGRDNQGLLHLQLIVLSVDTIVLLDFALKEGVDPAYLKIGLVYLISD